MACSSVLLFWYFLLHLSILDCYGGIPAPAQYFDHQIVDHIHPKGPYAGQLWSQRYYVLEDHFKGPGSPIFVILGGEGAIEPDQGIVYPYVGQQLAKAFGAYVLEPEHRFYGDSQPISVEAIRTAHSSGEEDPRVQLFTVEQALHDAVRLVMRIKGDLGCGLSPYDENYCPVITVGGSYPGFLSALARIMFPTVIDMAYAGSAPMNRLTRLPTMTILPWWRTNHILDAATLSVLRLKRW